MLTNEKLTNNRTGYFQDRFTRKQWAKKKTYKIFL